ncbi:hypothetical protein [Allokutzneria albata]|nr:hypothetical protein [Allokutzneria albata]
MLWRALAVPPALPAGLCGLCYGLVQPAAWMAQRRAWTLNSDPSTPTMMG